MGERDVWEFEKLACIGHHRLDAGDFEGAERALQDALDLWRGAPCIDLAAVGRAADAIRARLTERRELARTALAEARLRGGRLPDALVDLEGLVIEQPLREQHWWLLMLALYASARRAEALATFRRARRVLVDTAGIEPGPELRDLEARIHIDDPALRDLERVVPRWSNGPSERPRPLVVPIHLVRRHREVPGALSALLTARELEVAQLAIEGMSNPQIARALGTSPRTVGNQLQAIYSKLGLHGRIALSDAFAHPVDASRIGNPGATRARG